RVDNTLQDIVYKVVPGLYQREMKQRREFYEQHPDAAAKVPCPEDRGVVDASTRLIFSPDDTVSVSLEYFDGTAETRDRADLEPTADAADDAGKERGGRLQRRFLSCPAAFTVNHLQKFIRMKYGLAPSLGIDILYKDDILCDAYSLMDVAYIYAWKRETPLRLAFRVFYRPAKRPTPADPARELADVQGGKDGDQTTAGAEEAASKSGPETAVAAPPLVLPSKDAADIAAPAVVPAAEPRQPETPERLPSRYTRLQVGDLGAAMSLLVSASTCICKPGKATSTWMLHVLVPHGASVDPPCLQSSIELNNAKKTGAQIALHGPFKRLDRTLFSALLLLPAESMESPPAALSKITISTLDRSSNKIIIQTREVPPAVAQALSPPRSPQSKKSRRKEQREAERTHQARSADDSSRPWSRSPERPDGAPAAKRPRRDASPGRQAPPSASLPESAQQGPPGRARLPPSQTPRTPPTAPPPPPTVTRAEEDTRPLDLSQRGPPGPSSPAPCPRPQQHHHHRSSASRGFLRGANLTCINPDPDAFHPRIVIKNLPPRASAANLHRM
ncbi:unnamed protein product, partial [Ixodes hexagonus]